MSEVPVVPKFQEAILVGIGIVTSPMIYFGGTRASASARHV